MKESEFESVESKEESEVIENESSGATDAEDNTETEPSVLDSVPSPESSEADTSVAVSAGDSSPDTVSGGDISIGDITASSAVPSTVSPLVTQTEMVCTCSCGDSVSLWESDISEYDTTDGLLLLILGFVVLMTVLSIIGREI